MTGRRDMGHVPSPKEPVHLVEVVAGSRGTASASKAPLLDLTQLLLSVVRALLL